MWSARRSSFSPPAWFVRVFELRRERVTGEVVATSQDDRHYLTPDGEPFAERRGVLFVTADGRVGVLAENILVVLDDRGNHASSFWWQEVSN